MYYKAIDKIKHTHTALQKAIKTRISVAVPLTKSVLNRKEHSLFIGQTGIEMGCTSAEKIHMVVGGVSVKKIIMGGGGGWE